MVLWPPWKQAQTVGPLYFVGPMRQDFLTSASSQAENCDELQLDVCTPVHAAHAQQQSAETSRDLVQLLTDSC